MEHLFVNFDYKCDMFEYLENNEKICIGKVVLSIIIYLCSALQIKYIQRVRTKYRADAYICIDPHSASTNIYAQLYLFKNPRKTELAGLEIDEITINTLL